MTTILRHTLPGSREDLEPSIERHAGIFAQSVGGDTWKAADTAIVSRLALDNAARRAWLDPSDRKIVDDLELCACTAAAAHLAATTPGQDPLQCAAPRGRTATLTRTREPPVRLDPPTHWRWGMLAARVARNQAAIDALAGVSVESLLQLTTTEPPSWFASEAAALAATFRLQPAAGDLLVDAMRRTDPDRIEAVSRDWVLDVIVSEIELGFRALQNNQDAYDIALRRAIEGHHHFYGHAGEGHFHGQLAIAPLAMACLAHDLGLKTSVESDYIPRWIIERARLENRVTR